MHISMKLALVLSLVLTCVASAIEESKIHFRSGGAISGKVIAETKDSGKSYVVFRSESGSVYKIEKSKIRRVEKPGLDLVAYKAQLSTVDATKPSGHWSMYNWCKESKGRSKLRKQMKFHLKEIVRLDPSDEDAWRRLGEVGEPYVKVDGNWVPEEQHYASIGYVKSKGRWMPEVLLIEKQKQVAAENHIDSRKSELKSWRKNILKRGDPAEIRNVLFRILEPSSIGYFEANFLRKEKSIQLRALYLEGIGQVKSSLAQNILVSYGIQDPSFEVRETAILQLQQEHYPSASTVSIASDFLKNSKNVIVNRAGTLIGRIKDGSGIVPLIGSLKTQHKVPTGSDPGRTNVGFGSGGVNSFSYGEGPKFIVLTRDNAEVLQALFNITGQDFGFDSSLWREWYISQHTVTDYNLRVDADE